MNTTTSTRTEESSIDLLHNPDIWNTLEKYRDDWERSSPKRILIVRNSNEKNASLVETLARQGFSCEMCKSGTEAMKISRSEDFSLVAIWRGLPDVGVEDLGNMIRWHTLPESEIVLLDDEDSETAAAKLLQSHLEHARKIRDDRLYGDVIGGALFKEISSPRLEGETNEKQEEKTNRLHDSFRNEIKKLSLADSEIIRDEVSLKGYLAECLGKEPKESPERLLEQAIRAVRELNKGKVARGESPESDIHE